MLLTKMSSAIQQKFHLPIPEQKLVTNFFDNLHDLMDVIKFPQDLVVDTTLDGEKWTIIFNTHMKLFFPFNTTKFETTGFNNWFALAPPIM